MSKYEKLWERIWLIWLVVVAASFAILEGIGLVNRKKGDTLSENTRRWLGITPKKRMTAGAIGLGVALVGFVIWFWPHIALEVW